MKNHNRLLTSRAARLPVAAALAVAGTIALAAVTTPAVVPATTLENVRAAHAGQKTTVTLTGDGQLTPSNISEPAGKPRRLVLDFAEVSANTSAQDVASPLQPGGEVEAVLPGGVEQVQRRGGAAAPDLGQHRLERVLAGPVRPPPPSSGGGLRGCSWWGCPFVNRREWWS